MAMMAITTMGCTTARADGSRPTQWLRDRVTDHTLSPDKRDLGEGEMEPRADPLYPSEYNGAR